MGQQLKIPQQKQANPKQNQDTARYIFHTIQQKETFFSVSQKYHVQPMDIMEANPGLTIETFQINKNIRIPIDLANNEIEQEKPAEINYAEYKIGKRETMYSITRKFNIAQAELLKLNPGLRNGLKEGTVIRIPSAEQSPASSVPSSLTEREANALLAAQAKISRPDTIKLALLLPFTADENTSSSNIAHFIEYYEGLLLAVDSMQKRGVPQVMKLTVRDTGNGIKKLLDILKEKELEEAHLIIGGIDNEQIALIGAFAQRNQIRYAIPFSSRNDEVQANASILQVNTPHSYLLSQAAQIAYSIFRDHNIIFIDTRDADDKADFIKLAKQEFAQHNVAFRNLVYKEESFYADLENLLRKDKRNLVIPASGKMESLMKIRPALRQLAERTGISVNLFGYPEWQTYTREIIDDFFFFDTYIYTNFYADNKSIDLSRFNTKFWLWYGKIPNGFPKFGILGFDTGMFFLDAIARYGVNFENSFEKMNNRSLQTGFRFKRANNWGGFFNSSLFLVHYNKDNYKILWQEVKP
ncbi:peptidase M23 [Bacteroidia bacterium]|nr:peptidase M23 [Bacteroidia bacterium]